MKETQLVVMHRREKGEHLSAITATNQGTSGETVPTLPRDQVVQIVPVMTGCGGGPAYAITAMNRGMYEETAPC